MDATARWQGLGLGAATLTSCGLFFAAMALYPGGNWLDPTAPGHDFARNFLCDILGPVAWNGAANREGRALALGGYWLFCATFAWFWWLAPTGWSARHRRLGHLTRLAGLASAAAMVAVPLWPPSSRDWLHQIVVYLSGIPGGLAAVGATAGLHRGGFRRSAALAILVLATVLANGVVYAVHTRLSGTPTALLPTLQRVGALSMVAWVLSRAWDLARRRANPPG